VKASSKGQSNENMDDKSCGDQVPASLAPLGGDMNHEDQVALEILSEAIMKIDEELGLDAVAADDRLVIRALLRQYFLRYLVVVRSHVARKAPPLAGCEGRG
jgi:hypothetical protein